MEAKKTYQADLEHRRPIAFLLGLVLALALVYCGLQYTVAPSSGEDVEKQFDDLAKELDMTPVDQKDMVSAESPAPTSKTLTEKVRAVEKTTDEPQKMNPNSNPLLVGDGDGAVKNADVTQALPQTPATVDESTDDKNLVDELPEFPGGWVELMKWLSHHLKYPQEAQLQKIQGEVVVSCIIGKDGVVGEVKLAHSVHPLLDREALRVIKMMPRWKPGHHLRKPCITMLAIPVVFQL